MKKANFAKILTAPVLIAASLAGCSSEQGFNVRVLDVSAGAQTALYWPENQRDKTDGVLFRRDSEPYDKSTLGSRFMEHYIKEIR